MTRPVRLSDLGRALGRRAGAAADWAAARPWRQVLALLLLCCALHLPGIAALPVTDRDEARFAQATRQMLDSGDYIDIRVQDEPRWKKPVGIYWMQAAAVAAAGGPEGTGIWAWRIPSLLGAFAATLGALWALSPLIGARAGFLAAALTGASLILAAEATIAKTDAMLLALTVLSMGAWIRLLTRSGLRGGPVSVYDPTPRVLPLRLLLWGFLGLAVLVKGPIAPLVLACAALWLSAAERSWRPVRALGILSPGPVLFLLLVLPWLVAIHIASDGRFWAEAVGRDLLGKLSEGQESHGAPPGTYFAVVWAVLWPWAALLPLAAPLVWAARRRTEAALLLGWAVPFYVMLELTPTKLPHYLLPIAPALAGLVALWALAPARDGQAGLPPEAAPPGPGEPSADLPPDHPASGPAGRPSAAFAAEAAASARLSSAGSAPGAAGSRPAEGAPPLRRASRRLALAGAILFGLVGALLGLANLLLPPIVAGRLDPWGALLALAGLMFVALGTAALRRLDRPGALAAMLGAALTLYPATLQFSLPALTFGFPSEMMARASAPFVACAGRPAATQSYREPSLVFLQGTDTRLLSAPEAAEVLRAEPGGMVWIEDRRRLRLDEAFGDAPTPLRQLAQVEAFNPNRGGTTTLRLLARRGDPTFESCPAAAR